MENKPEGGKIKNNNDYKQYFYSTSTQQTFLWPKMLIVT